jgi:hypothetical protein
MKIIVVVLTTLILCRLSIRETLAADCACQSSPGTVSFTSYQLVTTYQRFDLPQGIWPFNYWQAVYRPVTTWRPLPQGTTSYQAAAPSRQASTYRASAGYQTSANYQADFAKQHVPQYVQLRTNDSSNNRISRYLQAQDEGITPTDGVCPNGYTLMHRAMKIATAGVSPLGDWHLNEQDAEQDVEYFNKREPYNLALTRIDHKCFARTRPDIGGRNQQDPVPPMTSPKTSPTMPTATQFHAQCPDGWKGSTHGTEYQAWPDAWEHNRKFHKGNPVTNVYPGPGKDN